MMSVSRVRPLGQVAGIATVLLLAAVVMVVAAAPEAEGATSQREMRRLANELGSLCKRVANFKKISQMEQLSDVLGRMLEKQTYEGFRDKLMASSGPSSSFNFLKTQSPALACLQQAEAITDLADIIAERENVCSSAHLAKIEHYFERHVRAGSSSASGELSRRITSLATSIVSSLSNKLVTLKFFELYADQVSFTCKSNLLHSLKKAEMHQLVRGDNSTTSLPWLSHANSEVCKKIDQQQAPASKLDAMQQQVSSADSNDFTQQEVQQCKASRALSEISTIHELVEAYGGIERRNDSSLFEETHPAEQQYEFSWDERADQQDEPSLMTSKRALFFIVPPEQTGAIEELLASCSRLRPIYEQTVLPIVRLARMGFNPAFANFDKVCSEDKLVQKWFGITLVCSSLLSSHLTNIDKYKELKEEFEANKRSLVIIDDESPEDVALNRKSFTSTETNFPTVPPLEMAKNTIEDELWVYKYGTTKLQRLKDGLLKKVFRLFKVEDIDSHVVFRKHLENTNRLLVKVVILTVSLLILRQ